MENFIRKDDAPVTIMFNDVSYEMDPKDFCINAVPLAGLVIKIDKVNVHKFLNLLTRVTKS